MKNIRIFTKNRGIGILVLFITCFFSQRLEAQIYPPGLNKFYSLGLNLPVAATGTFNVDASIAVGTKWTAHLPLFYNPFTFSNNKKYKNFTAMPGIRYWTKRAYDPGFFFGGNYIFSRYNFSGIFGSEHRYDGRAFGLGASVGYAMQLGTHWNLEIEAGLGVVNYNHDKYKCIRCGEFEGKQKGYYLVPNKTALGIVYKF